MKTKFLLFALVAGIGVLIVSCSPKVVAMQPSDPNVPQMPAPPKAAASPERIAQGKVVYEENCAKCHKLFAPSDFTSTEWVPILISMQPKAHLEDADMALISDYINSLTN